jgi:hypothetical protein
MAMVLSFSTFKSASLSWYIFTNFYSSKFSFLRVIIIAKNRIQEATGPLRGTIVESKIVLILFPTLIQLDPAWSSASSYIKLYQADQAALSLEH